MGTFPNPETQFKKGPQQVEIARRAGSVRSENKRIASRLRELKKLGTKDDFLKRIVDIMEDSQTSIFDLLMYAEKIKEKADTPRQMTELLQAMITLHKARHGDKVNIESKNINMNVNFLCYDDFVQYNEQRRTPADIHRIDSESDRTNL